MPDIYNRHYDELIKDFKQHDLRAAELPGVIQRIQQKTPRKYGLISKIEDSLLEKGIGDGSVHTNIMEDRANAQAELMRFIRRPQNIKAFKNLPDSQKQGIISLIKGGL